jgi:hypothetical protein
VSGSGDAEYDRVRNWELAHMQSTGSPMDANSHDPGVAPTYNGDGDGGSFTPEVDAMYADDGDDTFGLGGE